MFAANRELLLSSSVPFRLALIGVVAVSFALSACGRKGGLDPPPRAQAAPQQGQEQQPVSTENAEDEFGNPASVKGQKKRFPLDVLLN